MGVRKHSPFSSFEQAVKKIWEESTKVKETYFFQVSATMRKTQDNAEIHLKIHFLHKFRSKYCEKSEKFPTKTECN